MSGIQVINGAQTVLSINQAAKDGEESKFGDIHILLKITQTKDQDLKEKITRYNNSQTAILPADFRSNDPIQKFLNEKLNDYYYFGPEMKGKPKK